MLSGCLNEAYSGPPVIGLLMRETSEREETLGGGGGMRLQSERAGGREEKNKWLNALPGKHGLL